ncbi:GNAT family N-acetyltransferase [Actinobacteria bacterium YIM 96077]|uniref:GNAT family N-acetyltransferase n=1 Tax=Phytoactinopolyspora halophila TaxID=1981511 RepID=A0A329R1L9_9ACTN|nr:GNAT family N-acetyltransferase [Phytoactinopolyspora halophila]AYY12202.1 GNAT family N-acetyltransferase [Actinobacteria bacterium YIM 96077]RAW18564.1 GNAT family N-acetyltransferase [Phytoactinopolyspora halophila]
MTGAGSIPTVESGHRQRDEIASAAASAARDAAERAGVSVRALHDLADLHAVLDLLHHIWRPDGSNPLVTIEQLRAMTHAGNYVAGAFDVTVPAGADPAGADPAGAASAGADPAGEEAGDASSAGTSGLLGACVGFFAAPPGTALHSHIAGVSAPARGRNVGFALKLHQRAWALERGLSEITWTFDPLVRRNSYFNLVKLGARPREYLVDFYGEIDDIINAGQGTDRLLLGWDLAAPGVADACRGRHVEHDVHELQSSGAAVALAESDAGGPDAFPRSRWRAASTVLVQVPHDIEALRRADSRLARQWRLAVRDVLGELLADGARVVGFARPGWYVVERTS